MKVQLKSVGNPDHGQDSSRSMPGVPNRTVEVADFAEASSVCRKFIDENDLGSGNWAGGKVTDGAGKEIGRVSYNGCVWPPGGYRLHSEPLFDPRPKSEPKKEKGAGFRHDWLKTTIDLGGFGKVEVTGSFRHATITSLPGTLTVGGQVCEYMQNLQINRDFSVEVRDFYVHPDGDLARDEAPPAGYMAALRAAIGEWASSEEGKVTILRNELADCRNSIDVGRRNQGYKNAEIAQLADEIEQAEKKAETLEQEIAAIAPAQGPTP